MCVDASISCEIHFQMSVPHIKIVVIGNGGVGKTSLLITHVTGKFPSSYIPTSFDNYATGYVVDGQTMVGALWDTAGGVRFSLGPFY